MSVPVGKAVLEIAYSGPTDSTSVLYGNGYDKCGPLRYRYEDLDGNDSFSLATFKTSTSLV